MSNDVNVISRTQHIIVDPASSSVSVINAGPQGPGGPPGAALGIGSEEAVDAVAAALVEGANIDITYDDTANTITIASTALGGGITTEDAVDATAAALAAGTHTNVTVTYNDAANSISLAAPSSSGIPPGGTGGQVLAKDTNTDYDVGWATTVAGTQFLTGVVPPTPSIGVAGEYYQDTASGILYGPKSTSGYGTQQRPTIAFSANTLAGNDTMGVRYRFLRNGRVVGCRYGRHSSAAAVTIKIQAWRDSDQSKQAEVIDTQAAGSSGYYTITFSTPVFVEANSTWTFAETEATGLSLSVRPSAQTVTNTADVVFLEYREKNAPDTYPDSAFLNTPYVEPIYEPDDAWPVSVRTVVAVSDPELAAIAGLTSAADQLPYFTGPGAAALTSLTSVSRTLLGQITASQWRNQMGVGIGGTDSVPTVAPLRRYISPQTGTTYAPVTTAENTFVTLSNAAAITVTMPSNATSAFPIGAEIDFMWLGVGQPTFVAGSGATVSSENLPNLSMYKQYSVVTAKKIATNDWVIYGDPIPGLAIAFTPTFKGTTTNPNLGSTGTAVGYYSKIGDTVLYQFVFTFGGTGITQGSGTYSVTLPVPPKSISGASQITRGNVIITDVSPTLVERQFAAVVTTELFIRQFNTTLVAQNAIDAGDIGVTFDVGDTIVGQISYHS